MGFDWTQVEGYREDMSADEKLALLAGFEMPTGKTVSKETFDKTASDLAAEKKARAAVEKQLKDRMSEEELKETERQKADEELRKELETLRKERAQAGYKSELLGSGYDENEANVMAELAASGEVAKMISELKKANEIMKKALRVEIMKGTARPGGGDDEEKHDSAVEFARSIVKGTAAANKSAENVLSHYI